MKRLFCLLLAACVMLSLCACEKGRERTQEMTHLLPMKNCLHRLRLFQRRMNRKRRGNLSRHSPLPAKWMWI